MQHSESDIEAIETQLEELQQMRRHLNYSLNSSEQFKDQTTILSMDQSAFVTPAKPGMKKEYYTLTSNLSSQKTPIPSTTIDMDTSLQAAASTPELEPHTVRFSTFTRRAPSLIPKHSSQLTTTQEETESTLSKLKDHYEVEKIISHRDVVLDNGQTTREYFIKWKGYSDSESSWVKDKDMNCPKLLQKYKKKIQKERKKTKETEEPVRKSERTQGKKVTYKE